MNDRWSPHFSTSGPDRRCESGKIKFDKKGAQTAANKRWELEHVELKIYECKWCFFWHLSSNLDINRPYYNKKRR